MTPKEELDHYIAKLGLHPHMRAGLMNRINTYTRDTIRKAVEDTEKPNITPDSNYHDIGWNRALNVVYNKAWELTKRGSE